ncbi:MAG: hypothetical protein QOJ97_2548 [Solirubrobacteraceae bacterium]|nr:hypothetical protein [Solirubrobacteraceae bacterium]
MAWVESVSASFSARHESQDAEDAARVLEDLEGVRARLGEVFSRAPGDLTVVLHGSPAALVMAQPSLLVTRAQSAPAARRYLVGWFGAREIHVLAPRVLEARASGAEGSREALMLAPAALYASVVVGANNPDLPPPFTLGAFRRLSRWAWLAHGAAQHFSGQVPHLRPAIARRLREGQAPAFPPSRRDALLLGGTVFDLLAREEGERAAARLASMPLAANGRVALEKAFHGRALKHTDGTWRAHLARLAAAP